MTNCVNCGAVLKENICEYCGTRYTDKKMTVDLGTNELTGELKIGEKIFKVFLGHVEAEPIIEEAYRDSNGILHGGKTMLKHKFRLIEV